MWNLRQKLGLWGHTKTAGPGKELIEAHQALLKRMNRCVEVEQILLDASAGKRPLPGKDECRKLAMRLGDPDSAPLRD